MPVKEIAIDVVSDVVCPWCYMGSKRLEAALQSLPDVSADVRWRPFQLDPTIPEGGTERKAYMIAKFGSHERVADAHANLSELGKAEGIAFDFEAIKVAPNTLDAHRVIRWASQAGPGVQSAVVQQLFSLFFEQGVDIGDRQVLIDAAGASGMDQSIVEALLPTDADKANVGKEIETAGQLGIRGVPCFIIDGKYAVMGAQSAEVLADAIRKAAEASSETEEVVSG